MSRQHGKFNASKTFPPEYIFILHDGYVRNIGHIRSLLKKPTNQFLNKGGSQG
ncbi:hypothetical protein CHS0354_028271, partial [Potamilus streckersoni]